MRTPAILAWIFPSVTTCFVVQVDRSQRSRPLHAAPARLEDNVDGVLYVNERCIDCSTCSHFAPTVFERTGKGHHRVHTQPMSDEDIGNARAAMSACPVAAIRTESQAQRHHRGEPDLDAHEVELTKSMALSPKLNGLPLPFPRNLADNVWYLGHHNEKSFGATPYLTYTMDDAGKDKVWIMVDTPRFCKSAVDVVTQLTGPAGPDYLMLTHVDDSADHLKWKQEFDNLKRIFHSGDLGKHNWVGDLTLEDVEILLHDKSNHDELQAFDLNGTPLSAQEAMDHSVVIYHSPGHSPGSISMLQKDGGILLTGDTLAYRTPTQTLTGMPLYGNDRAQQAHTIKQLGMLDWNILAPGHGHAYNYEGKDSKSKDLKNAQEELAKFSRR